jgi:hypothetical protein
MAICRMAREQLLLCKVEDVFLAIVTAENRASITDHTLEKATMGLAFLSDGVDCGDCRLEKVQAAGLIVKRLRETILGDDYGGTSMRELLYALQLLCGPAGLHRDLVECGVLGLLEKVFEMEGLPHATHRCAIMCVAQLAFSQEVREKIMKEHSSLVRWLQVSSQCQDTGLTNIASKALFLLSGYSMDMLGPAKVVQEEREGDGAHVMISYAWAHQKLVLVLRDRLRSLGFKVCDALCGSVRRVQGVRWK